MVYKPRIETNNLDLTSILATINELPEAGGGGAEINAITASELPATVTDGQIVVITNTAAETIYVDTDEPASPVSGDVWVQVGSSNYGVEFSETFRNGLMWAEQYDGEMWVAVGGYIGTPTGWEVFTGRLPPEYQETEYIQSSGTQYINTRYVPSSQNFRVVYDFELPSGTTSGYLFGGMNTTHSIIASVRGVFYVGSTSNPIPLTLSSATRYEMDAHAESGTFTVVLNGTTKSASYSGSLDNSTPLFLFTHSKSGGHPEGSTWAAFTLYACQIFDNGALVRDFVPCYRKTDAVVGLYDLVNGVFYTSAGSGAFITGPAISTTAEQLQIIDILTGEVE